MKLRVVFVFIPMMVFLNHLRSQGLDSLIKHIEIEGFIYSMKVHNNKLYVAGEFDRVGYKNPFGGITDTNLLANRFAPVFNGKVTAACSDNAGGWYVSGQFTHVNGIPKSGMVHIDSNLNVTNDFSNGYNYYSNEMFKMEYREDTLYMSGDFIDLQKKQIKFGVLLDDSIVFKDYNFPVIDGDVYVSASDGNGGWFIGGDFSFVGGQNRDNLAHIDSLGNVTSVILNTSNDVRCLKVSGNYLFIGGYFGLINGIPHNKMAVYDIQTNTLLPWNPGVLPSTADIYSADIKGDTVFFGGQFTSVGGQPRQNFAAIRINNSTPLNIIADCSSNVTDLVVKDSILILSGNFSTINGIFRTYIGSLNYLTGTVTTFNPTPNGLVYDIDIFGNELFIGGNFTTIFGQPRTYLSSYDLSLNNFTSWTPSLNNRVESILCHDNQLFVSGLFTIANNKSRTRTCSFDIVTDSLTIWNPAPDLEFLTMSAFGNKIIAGGLFTFLNNRDRVYLAALKTSTETLTELTIIPNYYIFDFELKNNLVFLGGGFNTINGSTRNGLASIDINSNTLTSWAPTTNGMVNSIVLDSNFVIVGGTFTQVQGFSRNRLAQIDVDNASLGPLNVNISSDVYGLAFDNVSNVLYFGGDFTSVNGQTRNYLAKVDYLSGVLLPQAYNAIEKVRKLDLIDSKLAIFFKTPATFSYTLTLLDPVSEAELPYVIDSKHKQVSTFIKSNDRYFFGGNFYFIGGFVRNNIFSLDLSDMSYTGFSPNVESYIFDLELSGNELFIAGNFNFIDGQLRSRVASFDLLTETLTGFSTGGTINSWVYDIIVENNIIYLAGGFTTINGQTRKKLAAFDMNTSQLTTLSLDINDQVVAMDKSGNIIYFTGTFYNINGTPYDYAAAVNTTTGLLTSFHPVMDYNGEDIICKGNEVVITGPFGIVNGQSVNGGYFAADPTTGALENWHVNVNGNVRKLDESGNNICLMGSFDQGGRLFFLQVDQTSHAALPGTIFSDLTYPSYLYAADNLVQNNNTIILAVRYDAAPGNIYYSELRYGVSADSISVSGLSPVTTCSDGLDDTLFFQVHHSGVGIMNINASSDNQSVVPDAAISLSVGQTAGEYIVVIEDALSNPGVATITITVADSTGLTDSSSFMFEKLFNTVNVTITDYDTICQSLNQYVLTGGLPSNGFYWGNGVQDSVFYTSVGTGIHNIYYTIIDSLNSCYNTAIADIYVDNCSFISEESNDKDIFVFPNPVYEILTIGFDGIPSDHLELSVYDNLGNILLKKVFTQKIEISFQKWAPGIYYVMVSDSKNIYSRKVTKY